MIKDFKLWSVRIALLTLSVAAVALWAHAGATVKADDPPPTLASCCDRMNPGGRTVGGPALGMIPGQGGESIYSRLNGNADVCATIENMSTTDVTVLFFERLGDTSEGDGGAGIGLRRIFAGKTLTVCARNVGSIRVDCKDVCTYFWRVDADPK